MKDEWHHTTVLAVRRDGIVAVGSDGQVTLGNTVIKHGAAKVRTLAEGRVIAGFAGSGLSMKSATCLAATSRRSCRNPIVGGSDERSTANSGSAARSR